MLLALSVAPLACAASDGVAADESIPDDADGNVDPLGRKPKPPAGVECTAQTAAVDCKDGNVCTLDSCVGGRCQNPPRPNGTACDDLNACTNLDVCTSVKGGVPICAGKPSPSCASPVAETVNLGTAGNYVILAKAGISTVPLSRITGDVGLSPAAASNMTGFSLTLDASGQFSRSAQVVGMLFGADYAVPTPSNLTTAIGDMETAFTDAAGRAPDFTEVGAGNIGGLTLPAGVYKWGTGVIIPSDVTLSGSASDIWIFQVSGTLVVSGSKNVTLAGALPKNVFWQVSGLVDIGSSAHFAGNVLTKTAVTVKTGGSVNGRLLAQTAVSLQKATITQP